MSAPAPAHADRNDERSLGIATSIGAGNLSSMELADGTRIQIRPISPDDREALAAGFERLSPESRYRRFFTGVADLSDRELDYLTQVDHRDHEALVAIEESTGEGIAVARFVRIAPDAAEPAIVVTDEWQRRGVASRLLDALSDRARAEGIRWFVAPVLAENVGAIAALERLGETSRESMGREVELTVDLSEPIRARSMLHDVLRTVASGVLRPALGLWERLLRGVPHPVGFGRAIVVGMDDSGDSAFAADCAGELALRLGLAVHLVAAYRPLLDDRVSIQALLEDAEQRLRVKGVDVAVRLQRGDPALSILYVAVRERSGLIVVGAPPTGAPTALFPSRVWDAIAHHAQCNVLVARRPDARR